MIIWCSCAWRISSRFNPHHIICCCWFNWIVGKSAIWFSWIMKLPHRVGANRGPTTNVCLWAPKWVNPACGLVFCLILRFVCKILIFFILINRVSLKLNNQELQDLQHLLIFINVHFFFSFHSSSIRRWRIEEILHLLPNLWTYCCRLLLFFLFFFKKRLVNILLLAPRSYVRLWTNVILQVWNFHMILERISWKWPHNLVLIMATMEFLLYLNYNQSINYEILLKYELFTHYSFIMKCVIYCMSHGLKCNNYFHYCHWK